jgi:alkylhydroperoxidase family enzyme
MTDTLIQRLSDEADLCRNDGATDVAKLIDDAVFELVRQMNNVKWMKLRVEQQAAQIEALRADAERLRALATCGCGDGFTAHDPGTCGNCMAAIDAALRQEQPT